MKPSPSEVVLEKHLKSPLDAALEQSKKQLETLRTTFENDPKTLQEKERRFIQNETAKLEILGQLQVRLDEYRARHSHTKPKEKAIEALKSGNSEQLGLHLRAVGQFRLGHKWQAHHLVCSRHASHAAARFKLFAYVGINDPVNGCWLPQKHKDARGTVLPNAVGHAFLHTNRYARWVSDELRPARDRADLTRRLNAVRLKLQHSQHLPDILTPKGKADLTQY